MGVSPRQRAPGVYVAGDYGLGRGEGVCVSLRGWGDQPETLIEMSPNRAANDRPRVGESAHPTKKSQGVYEQGVSVLFVRVARTICRMGCGVLCG